MLVRMSLGPDKIDLIIGRWLKVELDKDELARTSQAVANEGRAPHLPDGSSQALMA
ncbi:hypothetical protein [Ferrovibrio sp.]|uniref:hypothetical protein n=1 Tax=Ferrovibrio sp. TaxID=1917215 RepID=UPI002ED4C2B5